MARFFGVVGYGTSVEVRPGVWEDVITEVTYYGDVVRNIRNASDAQKVNLDILVSNSISIVADAYALENYLAIRYVEWAGSLFIITSVEVQRPRLVLQLGGLYDGVRPTTTTPVIA